MFTKACPECGEIQDSQYEADDCPRCRGQGHLYRLMIVPELLLSAENNAKQGYDHIAEKRRGIAAGLMWYIAIHSAIEKASGEYSEAQREGLDNHAAWECAIDGMRELANHAR